MDKHYYQVVRKDELQHGLSFQKLGRKTAKYIAKIKKGAKTRYIYTQKELEAYKKALSSKDEQQALDKAKKKYKALDNKLSKNRDKALASTKAHQIEKPGANKARLKKVSDRDYAVFKKTVSDWEKSISDKDKAKKNLVKAQTLKGKVEAVRDTYRQFHPKQAKAIDKGKKKVEKFIKDTKTKANAYGKALSSKDEKKDLDKAAKKHREAIEIDNKARDDLETKKIERDYAEGRKHVYANTKDAKLDKYREKLGLPKSAFGQSIYDELDKKQKEYSEAHSRKFDTFEDSFKKGVAERKALSDYNRSLTLKGKAEDVRDTYRQFHPKKKKKKS